MQMKFADAKHITDITKVAMVGPRMADIFVRVDLRTYGTEE